MAKKKTDEEKDGEEGTKPDPDTTTSEDNNQQPAGQSKDDTDWEASYKGLQRTTQKKQEALDKLENQLEEATEQLEAMKVDKSSSEKEIETMQEKLDGVSAKLQEVTAEKGGLDKKLARQDLILEKHPKLAPFMKFIPEGESIESFEANAEEFAKTLGSFQEQSVQADLEGASPPPPGGDDTVSSTDADKAWNKAVALAGIPGKEQEYREAYDDWLKQFDAQSNH